MTLLELAAQAVEGLPPVGRWSFRPGLNALVGPPAAAEGVLRSLLALLFPEVVTFPGAPGARAGVTFLAADGGTYRLVGGVGIEVVLSKLDTATNKFVALQTDGGGLARVLRGLGLPERRLFEPLFWLAPPPPPPPPAAEVEVEAASELPTASGSGRGIESKLSTLMTGDTNRPKPRGLRELRQRLAEVETEERTAQELEQLQFQLDGLQQKLFQVEDTLKGVEKLRSDKEKSTHELSMLPQVSEEAVAQVQRLPQLIQKRDETLKRIVDERTALQGEDGGSVPTLASLGQDRMFLGAISIGAGSVAAAVIGSSFTPELRLLALLDIPGFGLAVLRACQHLSLIRRQAGVGKQLAMLTDRESRTNKAFENEARDAKALMKQLGAETVGELEERLAIRGALMERQQGAVEKLAELERDENVQSALASRDQLRQQVTEQEAKLQGFGGYRRDASEVRHEIEELHVEIARLGGAAPDDIHLVDDGKPPPDPVAALLRPAGELFGMTPAMLLQTIKDRAAQYVAVLTDRRYSLPAYGPDGGVLLARPNADPLPVSQVPAPDQEPCVWAMRLALAERYLSNHKLFLLLDERIAAEDAARRQLLVRLLQGLSRAAQVLWLGNGVGAAANHTVQLG